MSATFVVGIDLGTSHSVLSYRAIDGKGPPQVLSINQRVGRSEVAANPLLPSCLYAPLPNEMDPDAYAPDPRWVAGQYAQRRGTEVPSRFVASAKSWLGHGRVDRRAAILPYIGKAEDDGEALRISPVAASAHYLTHLRNAWDEAHPEAVLKDQDVVLTVPASFDAVARALTLEAAQAAGLSVHLLEEPQAAFYDHISQSKTETLTQVLRRAEADGRAVGWILVIDMGGGTTDLSLLTVTPGPGGQPQVARVAVGPHMLLGGDNMDLTLAHQCEPELVKDGDKLPPTQFAELTMACRMAKERLLGEDPPDSVKVSVLARGSQLLGNTKQTTLRREDVESILLDGFFPIVEPTSRPSRARGGLVAFGLPYERDVAVTRHIAHFLSRYADGVATPDAVLLNGGVFHAASITARIQAALASFDATGNPPLALPFSDPDLSVSRGAVRYGLARRGEGIRIEAGAAVGYYVGLAEADDRGNARHAKRAMCIIPRGAGEGVRFAARNRKLTLITGRPVRFDLYSCDEDLATVAGELVDIDEARFVALPQLHTQLAVAGGGDDPSAAPNKRPSMKPTEVALPVHLEGELTPIGTLDLACVEDIHGAGPRAPQRFSLGFQLRAEVPRASTLPPGPVSKRPAVSLEHAFEAIDRVFGKNNNPAVPREVKSLVRDLEKLLGARETWTTDTARQLGTALVDRIKGRKRSADHERLYWQLTGYCLRPGFGHPGDEARIAAIAPSFDDRLAFSKDVRSWQQFWIAWRRIAGGLSEDQQLSMRAVIDPFIAPSERKLKKPKGAKPESPADMLDFAVALERVPPLRRSELGSWILEQTWTSRDPRLWAALGSIGARIPAYASVHHVIGTAIVERWLDHLLREKWTEMSSAPRAAMLMARVTGDRARDVSERVRATVAKRLAEANARPEWIRCVEQLVEVDETEAASFFGEQLPVGLRLLTTASE